MPTERYFLPGPLDVGAKKTLLASEFHHLARVMRARVGDSVEIVNGVGVLAFATVENIAKDQATLLIEQLETTLPNKHKLILAQAFPRPNRLDFILEKGTELGVDEFWLFPGHLSQKKDFSVNQLERTRTLTIAAMKQSGRLTLPEVKIMPALEKWSCVEGSAFFGDLDEAATPLWTALKHQSLASSIIFFTGPESGWSLEETALLKAKGVSSVLLNKNILRTDTASMVAISLIQHYLL